MISLIKKKGINPNTKGTLYFPQWTRTEGGGTDFPPPSGGY